MVFVSMKQFWVTMKRFYSKRRRSKAKEEALAQIRKTRKKLMKQHPDLLNHIQKLYMEKQQQNVVVEAQDQPQETYIDRNKSIETVIKFLELSASEDMNEKIRTVLSSRLH